MSSMPTGNGYTKAVTGESVDLKPSLEANCPLICTFVAILFLTLPFQKPENDTNHRERYTVALFSPLPRSTVYIQYHLRLHFVLRNLYLTNTS